MSDSEPAPVRLPRIAILGAGSMGAAILAGLLRPGVESDGVTVTNRTEEKAAGVRRDGVVSLALATDPDANGIAVRGARVVIVAVKPAMVPDLLRDIRDDLEPDAIVVSVAAGVSLATMEALVPNTVLRAMPNTPALVGRGVTGIAAGSRADVAQLAIVRDVFETVGTVFVIDETRIDALSAVSGSGPAYVFYLIERFTETARGLGFEPEEARELVELTFRGASELLAASHETPAELRRRVTSPNGTTERAIAVLEEAELTSIFDRATAAAIARARELSESTPPTG